MSSREYRREQIKKLQADIDIAQQALWAEIDPHVQNIPTSYLVGRKECKVGPYGMCTYEKQGQTGRCIFCGEEA